MLNRTNKPDTIRFNISSVGLDPQKGYVMRDLWTKKNNPLFKDEQVSCEVPAHGVVVLKINGVMNPFNPFQFK